MKRFISSILVLSLLSLNSLIALADNLEEAELESVGSTYQDSSSFLSMLLASDDDFDDDDDSNDDDSNDDDSDDDDSNDDDSNDDDSDDDDSDDDDSDDKKRRIKEAKEKAKEFREKAKDFRENIDERIKEAKEKGNYKFYKFDEPIAYTFTFDNSVNEDLPEDVDVEELNLLLETLEVKTEEVSREIFNSSSKFKSRIFKKLRKRFANRVRDLRGYINSEEFDKETLNQYIVKINKLRKAVELNVDVDTNYTDKEEGVDVEPDVFLRTNYDMIGNKVQKFLYDAMLLDFVIELDSNLDDSENLLEDIDSQELEVGADLLELSEDTEDYSEDDDILGYEVDDYMYEEILPNLSDINNLLEEEEVLVANDTDEVVFEADDYIYEEEVSFDFECSSYFGENEVVFSDLAYDESNITSLAVHCLKANEIVGGFSDGTFQVDKNVQRAAAAKFLMVAKFGDLKNAILEANKLDLTKYSFLDVVFPNSENKGDWYAPFVALSSEYNVITGFDLSEDFNSDLRVNFDGALSGNVFLPGEYISTAAFFRMLLDANITDLSDDQISYLKGLYSQNNPDVESKWYHEYFGVIEQFGLLETREGEIDPTRLMNRGEVSVAIYKFKRDVTGEALNQLMN